MSLQNVIQAVLCVSKCISILQTDLDVFLAQGLDWSVHRAVFVAAFDDLGKVFAELDFFPFVLLPSKGLLFFFGLGGSSFVFKVGVVPSHGLK